MGMQGPSNSVLVMVVIGASVVVLMFFGLTSSAPSAWSPRNDLVVTDTFASTAGTPSNAAESTVGTAAGSYRVMVTGGAGFVGMHTSLRLRSQGHYVVAFDNLNTYYSPALKNARVQNITAEGVDFVEGDVCDASKIESILIEHQINKVIHLAAQAGVRYSLGHPFEYTKNNVDCFVNLLEVLKDHKEIPLVYASSSSVYGKNTKQPFSESDEVNLPASLYAATKRSNELIAHVYHNLYQVKSIGLRFFTVYGPWGRPDMAYWDFTTKILSGTPIKMFNHGQLKRDFTYIDDIVDGVTGCLDITFEHEILNLGNNQPVEIKEFVKTIEDSLGKKAIIEMVGMQKGDVKETYADVSKANKLLGYRPHTSLAEGIKKFVSWYCEYHKTCTSQ